MKAGDKVKILNSSENRSTRFIRAMIDKVCEIESFRGRSASGKAYYYVYDVNREHTWCFSEDDIELVEEINENI